MLIIGQIFAIDRGASL